jgi:amino acid transporter
LPTPDDTDAIEGPQEGEGNKERVDRELIELLNELRVALPGVQILFAFMLIVPFSQGFSSLTTFERWVYFAAFMSAALGAALLIAPSSYHRLRFRQGDKERMLYTSNRLLLAGMGFVAASMALAVGLISEYVFGTTVALIAGVVIAAWLGWFWYGLPLSRRMKG